MSGKKRARKVRGCVRADNMLSGRLQESTSRAPYLRYVNLDKNMMTGSLPPAIFSSTSLVYMSLVRLWQSCML